MKKISRFVGIASLFVLCILITYGCSKEQNDNDSKKSAIENFALAVKKHNLSYNTKLVTVYINERGQALVTAPSDKDSSLLFFRNENSKEEQYSCSKLNPGLYEITPSNQKIATLYYYSNLGKIKLNYFFCSDNIDFPVPVQAQLGDVHDICHGASGSIYELCFRMVMCHDHDLACPW